MQHYHKELESIQGEDRHSEEDPVCDLQCGDSLAIAASRVSQEVLEVK
jgi:hypothetical protein